ncbi:protein STRUBBELIG-RECEPTOR FAMILY 5-like [Iris pallida]|uniref:Protein STRUBBELIG-RECEPTOR FAMILY 5-like n=1 Tax=Iris pallida TaxID=29817 RepID=A0AAX6HRZ1_IRIPA|nr:protein STRUBBELIG-RECEPTOR FAMILY 5-like [Iris pallida]KAJ6843780.1 protein STRUBBELIG-RECEPTOR FAMILY 5-like [Iris pallida]
MSACSSEPSSRLLFSSSSSLALLLLLLLSLGGRSADADNSSNSSEVSALNVMFTSMNSPSQLTGWQSQGGDPCGDEDWKGISCTDSSITEIRLSGLGLSGSLGYQLANLASVTYFDVSKNNLQGSIPYQLPPNPVYLNLAGNTFTGGIPYSISQMSNLEYVNLGHNQLNGQLTDMFGNLPKLSELDLSFNQLSGNLPQSFGSLKSLKTLYVQNNQLSGSINVLANLPLEDLNVENNHFTGPVPIKLKSIYNLQTGGNSLSGYTSSDDSQSGGVSTIGAVIFGVVIAFLFLLVIVLTLIKRSSSSASPHYIDDDSQNRSFTPLVTDEFTGHKSMDSDASINVKALESCPSMGLKPPPSDRNRSSTENEFARKYNSKRSTDPASAIAYSLVDLQAATGSFSSSRLLGEGSIGCVYKAKYADGKVLAVKKINQAISEDSLQDFMDVISGISRLHHSNIAELVGFCTESGHQLLVYEFQRNGSLHEFLHLSDDYSNPLTWDTRVRIALGTARAVEYLHEVCSPSSIHKNIKSANILLDIELNPHLSDCGLAVFYQDTSINLGQGYSAPECTNLSAYTLKSDVYSFGVVMLELLTGRKPFDSSKPRTEQALVRWATPQLHDIDALVQMVDPALRGLYPPKSLSRFADVIALCVQPEPEFRPPMSEVVQSLVGCVQRTSMNKGLGGDMSASRRSEDSDYGYYN